MTSYLTKYRPETLDDVLGQDAVVKSLSRALKDRSGRAFLFVGPPGTGKTTLARICARELGCQAGDLLEIDAATYTGIDAMREVTDSLQYRPIGANTVKVAILDEAHALSKQAWSALLKSIEEPPAHVYWMLCTTDATKVPENIRTRCLRFDLKPVAFTILRDLLTTVAELEQLPCPPAVVVLCAKEAGGLPRQALANLAVAASAGSIEDASELLRSATQSSMAVDLAKLLVKGGSWKAAVDLLNTLGETNPESVRHVVRGYVTKVALDRPDSGPHLLAILDAFDTPFNSSDGVTPLVLAVGRLLVERM